MNSPNCIFNLTNGTLTIIEVPSVLALSYVAGTGGQTNYDSLCCAGNTPGATDHIQASADLQQWVEIATTQATQDGTIPYTDAVAPQYPTRYHRLCGD